MKKILVAFFSLLIMNQAFSKVLIITHVHGRPDFLELQYKTFKKFLQDDYEYVVFNDARNDGMKGQIETVCTKYGIRCIPIPQEIHTRPYLQREPGENFHEPLIRHANCIQYSFDVLGYDHKGIVFLVDSDAFLIRPFSISKYMEDKDVATHLRWTWGGVRYFSPILCFLCMDRLPDKKMINFNPCVINGDRSDTGGTTYYYLINHPDLRIASINTTHSHQLFLADEHLGKPEDPVLAGRRAFIYQRYGFNEKEINFLLKKPDTFEFYMDRNFLHYRGGSTNQAASARKSQIFIEFLNGILLSQPYELEQVSPVKYDFHR